MKIELMNLIVDELKKADVQDVEITNPNLLKERTTEEQIMLMEELKKCNYDAEILSVVTNPNVLEKRTIEEQIMLIEELKIKTHSECLNKINDMKELKNYVSFLKDEYGEKNNIELSDKVEFKVIKKTINENN